MDTKKQNRCGKRRRKNNLNNQQLQDDYFSITGLHTNNFVEQSKVNYKKLGGVCSFRTSTKKGLLFQIIYMKKVRIS